MAIALTYSGLQALGVPQTSLASFPAAFREGMAARAASFEAADDSLPAHWEQPYGTGRIHAALTLLCLSESKWQERLALARQQLQDLPAVQVLYRDDFAQVPGGRTPFGYKDGISFPQIRGNVQSPIVSREDPIAAGEFVLGYPGEGGRMVPVPAPDVSAATARSSDSASCTRVSRPSGASCATTPGRGSAPSFSRPRSSDDGRAARP